MRKKHQLIIVFYNASREHFAGASIGILESGNLVFEAAAFKFLDDLEALPYIYQAYICVLNFLNAVKGSLNRYESIF